METCHLLLTFNLITDYDTFINLDFNTSMASTTMLLKKSLKALKSQCHNRVRRTRSTVAWRVTLGRSSLLNVPYTLSRSPNCVAHELLRKRENHMHIQACNKYFMTAYYITSKVNANDYESEK